MCKAMAVGLLVVASIGPSASVGAVTYRKVADTNTPIPAGTGNFTSFGTVAGISSDRVAFRGQGSSGQAGIYVDTGGTLTRVVDKTTPLPGGFGAASSFPSSTPVSAGNIAFIANTSSASAVFADLGSGISLIADTSTTIPEGTGSFSQLTDVALSGTIVAFRGLGVGQEGLYKKDAVIERVVDRSTVIPNAGGQFSTLFLGGVSNESVAFRGFGGSVQGMYVSDPPLRVVADTTTIAPGTSEAFGGFNSQFPISGTHVAFTATTVSGEFAVYSDIGGALHVIADDATSIPNGVGTFDNFYSLVSLDGDRVAFIGEGLGGQKGLYLSDSGALMRVVDLTIPIDGKILSDLAFHDQGLNGDNLVFQAYFNDTSTGLYVATVPEPAAGSLFLLLLCFARQGRGRLLLSP